MLVFGQTIEEERVMIQLEKKNIQNTRHDPFQIRSYNKPNLTDTTHPFQFSSRTGNHC